MALLRLLLSRGYESLASLAASRGCSSGQLLRELEALQQLGVSIEGDADRGYRLCAVPDLLDGNELRALLGGTPCLRIELLDECDSTNAQLAARRDAPGGSVLACEYQSAGRGRRGRAWNSGIACALTFSVLWRFALPSAALSGLSLAVAVMVARALEQQGCRGMGLKWPNDLLLQDRKLGGILIELASREAAREDGTTDAGQPGARETVCIIGIGLNVRLPPAVAREIDRPVTDLASACNATTLPSRTQLLAAVLRELASGLGVFEQQGFAAFREAWLARHAHQGRDVSIVLDGRTLMQGRVEGLGDDGSLLLRSGGRLHAVHSGEVSLRGIE